LSEYSLRPCAFCRGEPLAKAPCPACNGKGHVEVTMPHTSCPRCQGQGRPFDGEPSSSSEDTSYVPYASALDGSWPATSKKPHRSERFHRDSLPSTDNNDSRRNTLKKKALPCTPGAPWEASWPKTARATTSSRPGSPFSELSSFLVLLL